MASEDKFLQQLGQRIAEIRKSKGITQEKLADMVDVHRTYIGFIEQGNATQVLVISIRLPRRCMSH